MFNNLDKPRKVMLSNKDLSIKIITTKTRETKKKTIQINKVSVTDRLDFRTWHLALTDVRKANHVTRKGHIRPSASCLLSLLFFLLSLALDPRI